MKTLSIIAATFVLSCVPLRADSLARIGGNTRNVSNLLAMISGGAAVAVILVGTIVVIVTVLKYESSRATSTPLPPAQNICNHCGSLSIFRQSRGGSGFLEFVLWAFALATFFLIFPAVIAIAYTIHRNAGGALRCADCNSSDILPIHSPRGQQLRSHFHTP